MSSVRAGDHQIAYTDHGGKGSAVVFAHSLGLDSTSWAQEVAGLGARHRVITIDMRGHGESDSPPGDYTVQGLSQDVVAVTDALELERFHFVGISTGGLMAQWLAINRPDRLITITCSNTAAKLGTSEGWAERVGAVRAVGMEGIGDQVTARFFSAGFAAANPDLVARARATLVHTDPVGYLGVCAALRDEDLRSRVAEIVTPTLIIGATEDVSTPPADAHWLAEHIPNARLVIIEGAGHVSNLENPTVFLSELAPHLAAHGA